MREGKSIFGDGGRIATTSDTVNKKCRGRRDTWGPPYGTVCRGGRLCPPGPDNATPCRAWPVCPAGCGKNLSGRCRHRPLRKRNKRCNGRATARVAPTKALQGVQWAGDRKGRPYGGSQVVQGTGRCGHRPLRRGLCGATKIFLRFMQIYTGKTAWDLLYSSL